MGMREIMGRRGDDVKMPPQVRMLVTLFQTEEHVTPLATNGQN
jgi:hypothetical protein